MSFVAKATPGWMHRRLTERLLVSRYDASPLGSWAREQARQNDLRAVIDAGHTLGAFDSRSWIGAIDVPTAVVMTRFDTTVLTSRQRAMADAIPHAQTFLVNGGHDICAVDPAEFVPALEAACLAVVEPAGAVESTAEVP
jgi:pimeloyl-ACP methyl ester carboxylesterase